MKEVIRLFCLVFVATLVILGALWWLAIQLAPITITIVDSLMMALILSLIT
jgi:multidrug resistance efflux pump